MILQFLGATFYYGYFMFFVHNGPKIIHKKLKIISS